jgi:hypothetical protein
MTEDAADLVSQVSLVNFAIRIGFYSAAKLLRKDRDFRLSDITKIKKHAFFGTM